MDPTVGGSFIPKKPLTADGRTPGGGSGILLLLAVLIFVASLVAAGAAFAYENLLQHNIDSQKASLDTYKDALQIPAIQELTRLDSRMMHAQALLQKHVAPSAIFTFLSTQTLQNVQLTSFDYTLQGDGSASIALAGSADSFSTVALQSDQLGSSKVLHDVVFSGIAVGDSGRVSFSVNAGVDAGLLLYSNHLNDSSLAPAPAPVVQASSTKP